MHQKLRKRVNLHFLTAYSVIRQGYVQVIGWQTWCRLPCRWKNIALLVMNVKQEPINALPDWDVYSQTCFTVHQSTMDLISYVKLLCMNNIFLIKSFFLCICEELWANYIRTTPENRTRSRPFFSWCSPPISFSLCEPSIFPNFYFRVS